MANNFPSHDLDFPITELKEGDRMTFVNIVDTHGHGRRNEYRQDGITPAASVEEARMGGTDTVFLMPNTSPRIIWPDSVSQYIAEINTINLGKQYVHVNINDDQKNHEEIEASLQHQNVVGIKIYPDKVTTNFDAGSNENEVSKLTPKPWSTLRIAAELCEKYNKTLTIHSETPLRVGESDGALDFVVANVLPLGEAFPNVDIVVAHENLITSAESIIRHNKKALDKWNKANVWMEIGAKYMLLNRENHLYHPDTPYGNPLYKCQPRLRAIHNNLSLASLIARVDEPGVNIVFGNDHAPHPLYKKLGFWSKSDMEDYFLSNFGTTNFADIIEQGWWKDMKDLFTPQTFEKAAGGIADYRHTVEASLTAALQLSEDAKRYPELTITYGNLQKFLSGNAMQLYSALQGQGNGTVASFERGQYRPIEDFYNGGVYNIWKHQDLQFKKTP